MKKITPSLPSISDLFINSLVYSDTKLYTSLINYHKNDVKRLTKNLSWDNIAFIGKANINVLIAGIDEVLGQCGVTGHDTFFDQTFPKKIRRVTKDRMPAYIKAKQKLKKISVHCKEKPLFSCFRMCDTYNQETIMVFYDTTFPIPHWSICAYIKFHKILSYEGYRYMPACIDNHKKEFSEYNHSLFCHTGWNMLMALDDLQWFKKNIEETTYINMWFDLCTKFYDGDSKDVQFRDAKSFIDSITSAIIPSDHNFINNMHIKALRNYENMVQTYNRRIA